MHVCILHTWNKTQNVSQINKDQSQSSYRPKTCICEAKEFHLSLYVSQILITQINQRIISDQEEKYVPSWAAFPLSSVPS